MNELRTRIYWIEGIGCPPKALLLCSGEIDISNIDRMEAALEAAIETEAPVVEVDVRKVDFLDSGTIEALLVTYQKLASEERTLRLQAGPRTRRLLQLLGLDGILDGQTPGGCALSSAGEREHRHQGPPVGLAG
jgi:anti-anti-sigma factor